ncbi:MAG TPA: tryptophan 7-halogenase [Nitrosopumilaceae archaeon]|nr:tryptophan 7-halogenase [Nitrosopumilaceae archaeon]
MNNDTVDLDVAIIGGGSAGCAAALTLLNQTSLKVGILESTNYDNFRVGESVSPNFLSLLRYLKIDDGFSSEMQIPSHGIDTSWGSTQLRSRDFFFTGQGNGWNLDRKRFDKMLADEVKKRNGIIFASTKVVKQQRKKNRWNLLVKQENKTTTQIKSNFVIDASGKNASFARSLGARWNVLDYLVAIASVYEISEPDEEQPYTLLESNPDGWWYSTLIPHNRRVVVFMTDSDIAKEVEMHKLENWDNALKKTLHIKKTIKNAKMIKNPIIFPAYSQIIQKIDNSLWVPAGDAVASFDPLSSIGIGHAIVSGIESARIAFDTIKSNGTLGPRYLEKVYVNFQQYLKNRAYFYEIEKRWKDKPFWKRRHAKVKEIFFQ